MLARLSADRSLSWRTALAAGLAAACTLSIGCVQRRLTIRSNPPGALVYIGNDEIGATPCSTDYVYYGKRKIRLVKDGYETLEVNQRLTTPWYDVFPLDFVTENVIPFEIRDERALDFQLTPQMVQPTDQLLGRAQNLRQGSHTPGFAPPPAAPVPTGTTPPTILPAFSPLAKQPAGTQQR